MPRRVKLTREQLIEKYDILGQIERSKKGKKVEKKEPSNVDLYIDDVKGNYTGNSLEVTQQECIFKHLLGISEWQ